MAWSSRPVTFGIGHDSKPGLNFFWCNLKLGKRPAKDGVDDSEQICLAIWIWIGGINGCLDKTRQKPEGELVSTAKR
jgi:hypothetical protein